MLAGGVLPSEGSKNPIWVGDGHGWPDLTPKAQNGVSHAIVLSSEACLDLVKFRTILFSPQYCYVDREGAFVVGLLCARLGSLCV